ncbi:MAG: hypothetical protein MJE66_11985 [Proteobacteria bacterium]|nr:hypothetical protein [Pseudomonadota bacterium]
MWHQKLAESLDAPVGTVKSLLSRARRKLRTLLAEQQEEIAMAESVLAESSASAVYHLHNGDAARAVLERAGLPSEHGVWAEVLHDGPVRGQLPREQWRQDRERFYASLGALPPDKRGRLVQDDRDLARCLDAAEAVLWFENDLYDQLCLIHHLDYFSRQAPKQLSLVCVGAFPGLPRFLGLGQLAPDQMASLFETRARVTTEQLELGARAWAAFVAPDPTELCALAAQELAPLPFLAAALRRFLEEYPGVDDGLSRTERQALAAVAAGDATGRTVFAAIQDAEESPFLGDLFAWKTLADLGRGPEPLVVGVGPDDGAPAERRFSITDAGRRVSQGEADAVALNGIDRWRGGVHLRGREGLWRYDPAKGSLRRR